MNKHIHIFGASGSGTTSISKAICEKLGYSHFDADDYFWLPTKEPFTQERNKIERINMLKKDLSENSNWILSGSLTGWAEELLPLFNLVVFVYVPKDIRIERLKKREEERYGYRVLPGGDRYEASCNFIDWASSYDSGTNTGRNLYKHKKWLETVECPVFEIENIEFEKSVESVISKINIFILSVYNSSIFICRNH